MGDERESGTVKILDETLREKEQEEKAEIKRLKKNDPSSVKFFRISKRHSGDCGSFEEGEPSNHHRGLTTRNSPCRSEDSREDRGEEEDFLAIKPPQKMSRKEKPCRRKAEKREEKRRHRIYSAGGKRARRKGKEREHELRKRHREQQNKARQDWATQRQRDMAREPSGTGQKHWEQLKRKREQQDRGPKGEEQRKEHEARKGVSVPRQTLREDYGNNSKASRWRCSPVQLPQECFEVGDGWRPVNEEKMEEHDLLSSQGDIRDKRNTSSADSLAESGAGLEEEVEGSTRKELQEEEEMRSNSEASGLSAEEMSDEEMSENEEPENENHILVVPESQFDRGGYRDSEETEEEVGKGALQSSTLTKEDYVPNSLTVCPPPNLSPTELKQELPKYLPALQGCRSVEEFQCLNKIEEGTYGVVYRAKDKKTGEIVALKRLKMEKEKEGFPITSLREINIILKAQHPNIITVREIVVGSNMDKIYIVMNYMEHDLRSLLKSMKQPFLPGEVKTLMIQLLHGVKHLHDNWILHRDLKTSNLLLGHTGVLKIGDFGLAREYGSPLKAYTPVVVTPWYRAPELLLGVKEYSTAIDMWSVGCIFGELLMKKPLFPGNSDIDQINTVFKVLGTPSEKIWPGYSDLPAVKKMTFSRYPYNNLRKCFGAFLSNQGFDLMNRFLTYCPGRRINAEDSLKHEYFFETPLPVDPCMLPTWPAKNEQQWVKGGMSRWPLEGGLDCSHLGSNDLKERGFHLATTNQRASATGPGFSLKF